MNWIFDAELDYHDLGVLNPYDVEKLLNDFIQDSHLKGYSRLLVITGKGKVVRPLVLRLLKHHKLVKKFESNEQVNTFSGSYVVYI